MTLPFQYHLEIYQGTFVNDPCLSVSSSTPMPSFTVGDTVDPGDIPWTKSPASGQVFRIAEVKHLIWQVETHVAHKLMIRVEVVRIPGG